MKSLYGILAFPSQNNVDNEFGVNLSVYKNYDEFKLKSYILLLHMEK